MAGAPNRTQTRRPSSPALEEWYVVIGDGDSAAIRMTSGLAVGETESGDLAINDPDGRCQWVEFVLADDGEPWAAIVTRDKSLSVAGRTCLRHPLEVGATLQLPHTKLYISRDILTPTLSGTVIRVVHRDIPHLRDHLPGSEWEESLDAIREPGAPHDPHPDAQDPAQLALFGGAGHSESPRAAWDTWPDGAMAATGSPRRAEQSQLAAWRRQVTMMAAVLAVGAGGLAGVVTVLVTTGGGDAARSRAFDPAPDPEPRVALPISVPQSSTPEDVPQSSAPEDVPQSSAPEGVPQTSTSAERSAATPPRLAEPVPGTSEPGDEDSVAPASSLASSPANSSAPAAAAEALTEEPPDGLPDPTTSTVAATAESSSPPAGVGLSGTAEPVPQAPAAQGDTTPDVTPAPGNRPAPSEVAALEETGLMAQALATELALQRDLQAADLALAQGRLTTPPESSAATLYNRVLAEDPKSPEATRGLQSVRQALINRALAALAAGRLDDAQRTLEAAAEVGADPGLVADLSAEVAFRQRSIGGPNE
jgi:hypothetical protein